MLWGRLYCFFTSLFWLLSVSMVELSVRRLSAPTCIMSSNKSLNLFEPLFVCFYLSRWGHVMALPEPQAGTLLSLFLEQHDTSLLRKSETAAPDSAKPTDSPCCPHPAGAQLPPDVPHLPLWVKQRISILSPIPAMRGFRKTDSISRFGELSGRLGWLSTRPNLGRNVTHLRKGWGPPQKANPSK